MHGRNIEIKARMTNPERISEKAHALSDSSPVTLIQTDTFYHCPNGRLKLREFQDGHGELIFYNRADGNNPKLSKYYRFETDRPKDLHQILRLGYSIIGVVHKTRILLLHGQTRIHLDDVENLGKFIELEVVMTQNQSEEEATGIAEKLMRELGISPDDLIDRAYIDLLT